MTDRSSAAHRGQKSIHKFERKFGLTLAASALTLAFATAVFAQDAAPTPDAAAAPVDDTVIVVRGVRASIQKSLNIKRRATQVVDSVVAEDVGKLPDNNVIEALQRVTGVQVSSRGGGEASGIFIRGMPDVTTTWNGRNVFTASGRQLALQDFPANLVSRIDVYKTRSAQQFEAGLGGQIDVMTRRPFDFKDSEFSIAARGVYLEPANKFNPNISFLASKRWHTGAGDVGVMLNASYARTQYRDENVTAGAMIPYMTDQPAAGWVPYEKIETSDGRAPDSSAPNGLQTLWQAGSDTGLPMAAGSTLRINGVDVPYVLTRDAVIATDLTGDRERPAVNLALQWAPNADSEYTFEYFYEGYRNSITQRMLFTYVDWWGSLGADPASTVQLYPGTNVVKSRTVNFPFSFTSGENTTQSTDTNVFALSGKWNLSDKLKLKADLSHVDSTFNTQFIALRATHVFDSVSVDFNAKDGVPSLAYGNNADAANPDLWNSDYFYDNANRNHGSATALTVDGSYDVDRGILKKISFGAHYDDHMATESNWAQDGCLCGPALSTYPEGFYSTNSGFFKGVGDVPHSYVVVAGDYLRDHADEIRELVQVNNSAIKTSDQLAFNKNFDIDEKTASAYVTADLENMLFGKLMRTELGLRYVDVVTDLVFGTDSGHDYTHKFLPSLTVRYDVSDDVRLRLNYGETLRRPNFGDLNPHRNLYAPLTTSTPYGNGNSGNANLKSSYSKNFDVGFEWYFAKDSIFYSTLFHREIDGLVLSTLHKIYVDPAPYTVNGTPIHEYLITSPLNASEGTMDGGEFGLTYFPKDLPGVLDGFGVQGSVTVLRSSQNVPLVDSNTGEVTGQAKNDFFGVSNLSYNVTLVYDKGPFNARLSHVWRDDWLSTNEARLFANPIGIWQKAEGFTDFQMGYNINDKMAVTFDATNIFNQKSQAYYKFGDAGNAEQTNFSTFVISRQFAVGFRWKY